MNCPLSIFNYLDRCLVSQIDVAACDHGIPFFQAVDDRVAVCVFQPCMYIVPVCFVFR